MYIPTNEPSSASNSQVVLTCAIRLCSSSNSPIRTHRAGQIRKNNSVNLPFPTPVPTCPTRQGPAPTESGPLAPLSTCPTRQVPAPTEPGPLAPLSSTKIQVPKASPPTLSQARDLRLRQEMLLRRELSLNKDGGPAKPKAPPPTLSAEEKEHLRREFGNGKLGAESTSRSLDANQGQQGQVPAVPKQPPTTAPTGRPRRKLGSPHGAEYEGRRGRLPTVLL